MKQTNGTLKSTWPIRMPQTLANKLAGYKLTVVFTFRISWLELAGLARVCAQLWVGIARMLCAVRTSLHCFFGTHVDFWWVVVGSVRQCIGPNDRANERTNTQGTALFYARAFSCAATVMPSTATGDALAARCVHWIGFRNTYRIE